MLLYTRTVVLCWVHPLWLQSLPRSQVAVAPFRNARGLLLPGARFARRTAHNMSVSPILDQQSCWDLRPSPRDYVKSCLAILILGVDMRALLKQKAYFWLAPNKCWPVQCGMFGPLRELMSTPNSRTVNSIASFPETGAEIMTSSPFPLFASISAPFSSSWCTVATYPLDGTSWSTVHPVEFFAWMSARCSSSYATTAPWPRVADSIRISFKFKLWRSSFANSCRTAVWVPPRARANTAEGWITTFQSSEARHSRNVFGRMRRVDGMRVWKATRHCPDHENPLNGISYAAED